ncbi:hypothetical protein [Nocardia amamiensis]|uniref:Uncharacterized protein n=1 Tax=Nocardia amamiensis TaxID=404578 RepID=A0ABS0D1W9_9NOCA|nr:hypothetical protein [Nocardia amamiensis]MBF6302405.1 hypothetical protein [Nocardia amamiensis]
MTTPTPRPNVPGTPAGGHGPRPGVPLPGQHPGAQGRPEPADPERIRGEVDSLLAELERPGWSGAAPAADSAEAGVDITRRARILEQAHDVLVQALATVDKI